MYEAAGVDSSFQTTLAVTPAHATDRREPALFAVELLMASLEALRTNRQAATDYISRACSVLLEGHQQNDSKPSIFVRGGLVPWQIKRVKSFIDDNLEKPLTVREIASVVRLGPGHFHRAFRISIGVSPHAYLVSCRVKRAQELMLTSNASLSQIALQVGFSDQAHLTTRFHRVVGITPALWRRERADG